MQRKLISINEEFRLFNGSGFSNAIKTLDMPRHRWYFVKEAFSPTLVEKAIEFSNIGKDKLIIDPFCGSGTVPLVASINGYRGLGFEVNPFLAFVSATKLLNCDIKELVEKAKKVRAFSEKGAISHLEGFSTFTPKKKLQKWLFNISILRAFSAGWNATMEIDAPIQNLLQLVLLGSIMDCSNATRDGKALRYRKNWVELNFGLDNFLDAFDERLMKIEEDLQLSHNLDGKKSKIIQGDSRKTLLNLKDRFSLCVTSPPYLNSFDYTDVYRPELFLGNFIESQKELRELRFNTVRSHVQCMWDDPIHKNFGSRYQGVIKLINKEIDRLWNQRIGLMVQAYFEDMKHILIQLKRMAETNAILWLIVSTSAYGGIEIPVDLILADIGLQVGWEPIDIGLIRNIRSSSQHYRTLNMEQAKHQLRESVVILKSK